MTNMTFSDFCRSNGGSYEFGALETFVQHAKIYKYTDFHPNRTGHDFPIGSFPCPLTFGSLCRSSGGSYEFEAMETFNQHANIYQYADFYKNRTRDSLF